MTHNPFWYAKYARPVEPSDIREVLTPERAKELVEQFEKDFPEVGMLAERIRARSHVERQS